MRIQHQGGWINVGEQLMGPLEVQQRQKNVEAGTNLFSPHLSDAVTRERALELIPSIAKAATDKKRAKVERIKLLRTLSAFQKTAYLVDDQLETAKSILKFSKCAHDWHHLRSRLCFRRKNKRGMRLLSSSGETATPKRHPHSPRLPACPSASDAMEGSR